MARLFLMNKPSDIWPSLKQRLINIAAWALIIAIIGSFLVIALFGKHYPEVVPPSGCVFAVACSLITLLMLLVNRG